MNDNVRYELPRGWVWTKLGDICLNVKVKSVESSVPYLEIGDIDIQNKKYLLGEKPTVKGALMSKKYDILISKVRPTRGAITITQQKEINVSSAITVLRTCQEIIPFYIHYFLAWNKSFLNYLGENSAGTMYPTVKDNFILIYDVPLSPLHEQRAIVSKIEQLFSDLDNGIENFKKAQEQLKIYRKTVLKNACEGKLVPTEAELARAEGRKYEPADVLLARILEERREKWDGKGKFKEAATPDTSELLELPEGWVRANVGQIADHRLGKMLDKEKNEGELRPYLRNINVRWFEFDLSDIKYMRVMDEELENISVRNGDLIICEGGEPGRAAIWDKNEPMIIQKALHRVRPNICVLPTYFTYCLSFDANTGRLDKYFTGTTIKHFTGQSLHSYVLSLPTLAEQHRIVTEVERRLSICDNMEATITESLQKAESLRQSILKKAFEGKLLNERELEEVRNAPDWEPAEKLLERIKAEKTNTKAKKKGKK